MDVLVVERLAVDALAGRRDPGSDLAALVDGLHERAYVRFVDVGGQAAALAAVPVGGGAPLTLGCGLDTGERADSAVERDMRQAKPLWQAGRLEDLVPAVDAVLAVGDVLAPQVRVEPHERGDLGLPDLA